MKVIALVLIFLSLQAHGETPKSICVSDLRGEIASGFKVVLGEVVRESDSTHFEVRDVENDLFFESELQDGVLHNHIELVRARDQIQSAMSGRELFAECIKHFRKKKIRMIRDTWIAGTNYDEFLKNRRQGLSKKEAAKLTWTGRQAAKFGFTKIQEVEIKNLPLNSDGFMITVDFVRP